MCDNLVHINNNNVEIPMNSKAEWHQPVVARVVVTRELEELQVQGGRVGARVRGQGGGGRGQGGRSREHRRVGD